MNKLQVLHYKIEKCYKCKHYGLNITETDRNLTGKTDSNLPSEKRPVKEKDGGCFNLKILKRTNKNRFRYFYPTYTCDFSNHTEMCNKLNGFEKG